MQRCLATQIQAVDLGDYRQIAFGLPADRYVIVQLARQFDAQDRASGMDGIYLEIDDQAHAAYRSIDGIALAGRVVTIRFDPLRHGLPAGAAPLCIECAEATGPVAPLRATLRQMATQTQTPFSEGPE